MDERLIKNDWIDHGLRTLARSGAHALKVVPMAAGLNVSRGSFYWHFRDISDFRAQLLRAWQERTTEQVIRELEAKDVQPDRLKHLMRRAFVEKPGLDRAVRAWAAQDAEVAAIVASVDSGRVAYIAKLLVTAGVPIRSARYRAAFLYWAYLGRSIIMDPQSESIAESALDAMSELLEK